MQRSNYVFKNKSVCWSLFTILLLGCFLRFYGISKQSLWGDELSSWIQSNHQKLLFVINQGPRLDVHPPGYQILLFFVERIGDSEFMLRLPSAIAGVLAIFFIFLLGLEVYTYKEALIASALLAVLRYPIHYSQEARSYSILLLFSLITAYFWIKLLKALKRNENKNQIGLSVLYVITGVICSYLHYFGLLLIILQIGALILFSFNKIKAFVSSIFIGTFIALAYIPWFSTILSHLNKRPVIGDPPAIIQFYIKYMESIFNYSTKIVIFVLFGYLFLLTLNTCNRRLKNRITASNQLNSGLLLILWLIIPFLIASAKSFTTDRLLSPRNLIICLPPAYLLFSRAIAKIPLPSVIKKPTQIGIILFLLFHTIFIIDYYFEPHKAQFREASSFIVNLKQITPNESLIIGYSWDKRQFEYYFSKMKSDLEVTFVAGKEKHIERTFNAINKENPRYIWYIEASRKAEKGFIKSLNNRLDLIVCAKYYGAKVWLFKNPAFRFID